MRSCCLIAYLCLSNHTKTLIYWLEVLTSQLVCYRISTFSLWDAEFALQLEDTTFWLLVCINMLIYSLHFPIFCLLKVRIWDMKYLSRIESDTDAKASKLLATLRDHFGSVKQGRLIASGSDDQIVLIHERRPGSGTTEFGSGEPPDVENWKVSMTLRGHTADVVMLFFSFLYSFSYPMMMMYIWYSTYSSSYP